MAKPVNLSLFNVSCNGTNCNTSLFNASCNGTDCTFEDVIHPDHTLPVAVIFFIFVSCAVGALLRHVSLQIHLPYTVMILVIGALIGGLVQTNPHLHNYTSIVDMEPHLLLHIFLPILIFESAFNMEVHTFSKSIIQIVILAIPGFAVAALMTCVMTIYLFQYGWDWLVGMMFGSILSATDPVSVVALLRDLGASKELAILIEGESLLNDGAAIVFFNVFLALATPGSGMTGGLMVLQFIRTALGGPVFGYVMAKLTIFWLSRIFNDGLAEITITLATTYITYYVGEIFLGVSGVLSVVVLGVSLSARKTSISPEVELFLNRFWELLAYLANTLIFIVVGMVIEETAIKDVSGSDWFYLVALYFGVTVIRTVVIGMFMPVLSHLGYGLSLRDMCVMTWGGLRGAVGLALAMLVANTPSIPEKTRHRVLFHVSGIVFLTLLINGTTIKRLLKILGMSDASAAKRMTMAGAINQLRDRRQKSLAILKTDRFLADADWDYVEKECTIQSPYRSQDKDDNADDEFEDHENITCPQCDMCMPRAPTASEMKEMKKEAIIRMLKAEKMSYRRQFERGLLSREAVRKLKECTEVASDNVRFINIEDIKASWKVPNLLITIKRKLKRWSAKTLIPLPKGNTPYLCLMHRIVTFIWFPYIMYTLIILSLVETTIEITEEYAHLGIGAYFVYIHASTFLYLFFFLVEAGLKVCLLGWQYFRGRWNQLCMIIIVLGLADAIIHASFNWHGHENPAMAVLITFKLLRIIRVLRFIEHILPLSVDIIRSRVNRQLTHGYDVGRGFIAGEEEVAKLIPQIIDNRDISRQLLHASRVGRLEVIKTLGLLQKEHPDVALAVKSRQAIRTVLNNLRDCIQEMREDGILDGAESSELEIMVETKMKRLLNATRSIKPPPPEKMLRNIAWLQGNEKLVAFIKERTKVMNYNYGDVIMSKGEPTEGIYLLISGMVRMESPIRGAGSEDQIVVDYMTSGNITGEMGFLTHKPRQASIWCETAVQAFFLSSVALQEALNAFSDLNPPLEYRLWRVCAIRIAVSVLIEQPSYQGLTKEQVKLYLQSSYVANPDVHTGAFVIDSSMADIVLIYGLFQDAYTHEQFRGPCHIPWTTVKLTPQKEDSSKDATFIRPVFLIIPTDTTAPSSKQGHTRQRSTSPSSTSTSLSKNSLHSRQQFQQVASRVRAESSHNLAVAAAAAATQAPSSLNRLMSHDTRFSDQNLSIAPNEKRLATPMPTRVRCQSASNPSVGESSSSVVSNNVSKANVYSAGEVSITMTVDKQDEHSDSGDEQLVSVLASLPEVSAAIERREEVRKHVDTEMDLFPDDPELMTTSNVFIVPETKTAASRLSIQSWPRTGPSQHHAGLLPTSMSTSLNASQRTGAGPTAPNSNDDLLDMPIPPIQRRGSMLMRQNKVSPLLGSTRNVTRSTAECDAIADFGSLTKSSQDLVE